MKIAILVAGTSAVFATPAVATLAPTTWAMMVLGFGAAGYTLRRRARAKAQAFA